MDDVTDVPCAFAYPDTATAIAALSSAGPVVRVAEHAGAAAVRADIDRFLAGQCPFGRELRDRQSAIRYAISAPVA